MGRSIARDLDDAELNDVERIQPLNRSSVPRFGFHRRRGDEGDNLSHHVKCVATTYYQSREEKPGAS
jgi:hypothetical protein